MKLFESTPEAFHLLPENERDTSDVTPARSKDNKEQATRDVCGFSLNPAQPACIAEERTNVQHEYILSMQGQYYAGKHLLLDVIGSSLIEDIDLVEKAFKDSVRVAGATVLHSSFHRFPTNNGFSGVCVLAQSHISIHTWPEFHYAAIDIFMCGAADPYVVVKHLKRAFNPDDLKVTECARGLGCIGEVA